MIESSFIGGGTPFWKPRKQNVLKYKCSRATVSAYIAANQYCSAAEISTATGGRTESVGAIILSLLALNTIERSKDSKGIFRYTAIAKVESTATAKIRKYLEHGEFVEGCTILCYLDLKGDHQKLHRMTLLGQLESCVKSTPKFPNRQITFYKLSDELLKFNKE